MRTEAILSILSWLARNGFAPRDDLIAPLAKSIIEPPVTRDEDFMGCSFPLNLADAFNGFEIIEEQLKTRLDYQEISSIAEGGPFASKTSYVKLLPSVKGETLKLTEIFLDKAEDQSRIGKQLVSPMMDPILGDYTRNVPDARESEILSLFAILCLCY